MFGLFGVAVSIVLLTALKKIEKFWIFNNKTISINPESSRNLNYYRIVLFLKFSLFSLAIMLPQFFVWRMIISLQDLLLYCFVFPLLISLLISPDLCFTGFERLIFNISLTNKVTIHLADMYQPYDKRTYTELLKLFKHLSTKCKLAKMSSPMFYHSNGELRNLDFFTRWADNNGFVLEHCRDNSLNLLPKLKMKYSNSKNRDEGLKKIHLNLWYKFVIKYKS